MKVLKVMSVAAVAAFVSVGIFVFLSEPSGQGPAQAAQQGSSARPAVLPDPKPLGPIEYINPNPPKFKREYIR